jgi:hypothetical protein
MLEAGSADERHGDPCHKRSNHDYLLHLCIQRPASPFANPPG